MTANGTSDLSQLETSPQNRSGPRPLTSLVPLRVGGRLWLALLFGFARLTRKFFFRDVQRMTLVYAMQWSVLRPFSRFGKGKERKAHLLFETNFAGEWHEYIEGFARSVPRGMRVLFGATLGYPGLTGNVGAFVDFVGRSDIGADFYYYAYTAEPLDIQRALLQRASGGAPLLHEPEFTGGEPVTVRKSWWITSPSQIEVVIPIRPGRAAQVRNALDDAVQRKLLHQAFSDEPSIHFARLVVLDFASGSYLLFTATYDSGTRYRASTRPSRRIDLPKEVDVVLGRLAAAANRLAKPAARQPGRAAPAAGAASHDAEPDDPLRVVLRHCVEYPRPIGEPERDRRAIVDYLLAHQRQHGPLSHLSYCAYPNASLSEVRQALQKYPPQ